MITTLGCRGAALKVRLRTRGIDHPPLFSSLPIFRVSSLSVLTLEASVNHFIVNDKRTLMYEIVKPKCIGLYKVRSLREMVLIFYRLNRFHFQNITSVLGDNNARSDFPPTGQVP